MTVTTDYQDAGLPPMPQGPPAQHSSRRRTPRWVPVLIGALAFVLVLAGVGLVAADWFARNSEMNTLIQRVVVSETAMGQTQNEIEAAFAEYDSKTATLTAEQKAALAVKLKAAATAGQQRIASAGEGVRTVQLMPWHGDIAAAQRAYVTHNRAWQDYMAAAEKDPAELLADQPEVNDTFNAAEPLMKQAVPKPPLFDLERRVADIFTSGQAQPDFPTQEALLRR
ncbi:unannotated protein [freshwater metagenome]|uniref:Unannotated protein n=1 Tax=freshwater metagenome TaxID=449393 RepID=A0A6J7DHR5_9ZZZZ